MIALIIKNFKRGVLLHADGPFWKKVMLPHRERGTPYDNYGIVQR